MEVKNQMLDLVTVGAAAQNGGAQKAQSKNAEKPDFDTMVQQKRAEKKPEAGRKDAKASQKPENRKTAERGETAGEEKPEVETGENIALATAMLLQTVPEGRVTVVQPEETVELMPEVVTEAVVAEGVETVAEAVTEQGAENKAEQNAEALPETEEAVPEQPKQMQTSAQAPQTAERTETRRPTETVARTERAEAPEEREERPEENTAEQPVEAQATPLFERVDAPVVKVAEAPRPVELEAGDGIEQLGRELGGFVVNRVENNRVEITLTPENLGKLTVEITRGTDGTLNIVLHTASERAANLLEKGADGLRQMLAANAQRDVQVQVRGNEETQQQFLNPDGQNEQQRQGQQQQGRRREERQNAQDFMQQLRLGLVEVNGDQ